VRRRIATIVAALAAVVVLSACVSIPTGGGVTTQEIPDDQGGGEFIRTVSGPQKGMTPREIVAGFVRAGGGPQGQYTVAKEYLADSLQSKWNPGAGTLVSDSPVTPEFDLPASEAAADLSVDLDVVGQIDSTGVYTAQATAERVLSFHLVKQKGQWRIDRAPDGTVLRSRDLGSIARPYDLYFFDPGYDYLVPDLRWFVDQGPDGYVPRRIVAALLAGPAKWLASPVVVSAFPSGTQIDGTPTIDSGEITVDLSAGVGDAAPLQQARMLQQLTWSLRALDVHAVSMTASGLAVPVSDASSADASPGVTYEAIGSDGKTFGAVTPSGLAAIATLGGAVQALAPTAVTLGRDRTADDSASLTDRSLRVRTQVSVRLSSALEASFGTEARLDDISLEVSRDRSDRSDLLTLFPTRTDHSLGAYSSLRYQPDRALYLEPGVRVDQYFSRGEHAGGLQPRLVVGARLSPRLTVEHRFGLASQKPNFVPSVPAAQVGSLDRGLVSSAHLSSSLRYALPLEFSLTASVFESRYTNVVDPLGQSREFRLDAAGLG